jgi:hypothetical protein
MLGTHAEVFVAALDAKDNYERLRRDFEDYEKSMGDEELEAQAQILIDAEKALIKEAWDLYLEEREKNPPRYIPIARQYVPCLRHIFWHGFQKDEAQAILEVLELEQTQPFNSLDDGWGKNGDGYEELDSYTLELITDDPNQEAAMLGNRAAPIVPNFDDGLTLRIVQEYAAMGYTQDQISKIVEANRGSFWDEEEIWYEDRGISAVAILQNEEQEYRVHPGDLAELRSLAKPYIDAFIQRRTEFFDWAREKGIGGGRSGWANAYREMCNLSLERQDFLEFLQKSADEGYDPQCIMLVFLSIQNDEFGLDMDGAKEIHLPSIEQFDLIPVGTYPENFGTLYEFIDYYGDDILEELFTPAWNTIPTSESEILATARRWEEELIESYPVEAPQIRETRAYVRGVFNALATGESNLNDAGYRQWRWEKSKSGALAYDWVMATDQSEHKLKKAWRAFWNAGKIVRISRNGLVVESEAKEEEQSCNWALARWKLANKEIFLTSEDRERLRGILTEKGWGRALLASL